MSGNACGSRLAKGLQDKCAPAFFPLSGTRLMARTLVSRAWNEAGEVVTGRRPNDKRRRGSNNRSHRPLD
jgi:hypothetical protein